MPCPACFPSCRNALNTKLKQMGFELTPEQLNDMFKRFKTVADRKKVRKCTGALQAKVEL